MSTVTLTPATREDFAELAARSEHTPMIPPVRVVAIAGKVDGKVIAIGGIAFWPNGTKQAFADIGEEARKYPIALHKAALAVIELAKKHNCKQLRAVADEPKVVAEKWLMRLGFEPVWVGTDVNYVREL